jgi:hypothetical protein
MKLLPIALIVVTVGAATLPWLSTICSRYSPLTTLVE